MTSNIYAFQANTISGQVKSLADYQGKLLLIVNTASHCGFTPQFDGLEKLYQQYKAQGFEILAFPCNQFAKQDPAENQEILAFCQKNYGVSFPVFAKIEVNGKNTHPLYKYLKSHAKGVAGTQNIKWNFSKFLVGRDGRVIQRFSPISTPESLNSVIQANL